MITTIVSIIGFISRNFCIVRNENNAIVKQTLKIVLNMMSRKKLCNKLKTSFMYEVLKNFRFYVIYKIFTYRFNVFSNKGDKRNLIYIQIIYSDNLKKRLLVF